MAHSKKMSLLTKSRENLKTFAQTKTSHMKSILCTACLLFGLVAYGQSYVFSTFTAGYSELTDPTVFTDEEEWDDPTISINMPFDFQIGNTDIPVLLQIGYGAEWGGLTGLTGSIFGYYPDLIAAPGGKGSSISEIGWKTEGAAGNRILKIQYKDAAFYNEVAGIGTADNWINFQIWLYEADNAIEFRFGTSNILDADLVYDDLPGPPIYIAGDINLTNGNLSFGHILTGNPASPELESLSNYDDVGGEQSLNGTPASGRVYRFAPGTVGVNQVQAENFSIYPTLAENVITLRGDINPGAAYHIFSLDGRILNAGVLSSNTLDVSSLASGTYLLQIDEFGMAQKFVKR
jgi:hypothetical protein